MNTTELNKEVDKAAYSVADQWPGAIEADDLRQELWVKLLESVAYREQMTNAEPALRMELLKRMGRQIAGSYVNDYELFSGNAFYGTEHTRELLDAGILTVARSELGAMNETLTEFLDAQEAFTALKNRNRRYADVLWSAYAAGEIDRNSFSVRKTLSRAVKALTDLMNQAHRRRYAEYESGPGTREVISNAKARVISSTHWDGDQ